MEIEAKSVKLNERFENLQSDITTAIIDNFNELGIKELDLGDDSFTDESNNKIVAVDTESVWFNDGDDCYPLLELGIEDAIYVLVILEKYINK